MVVLRGREKKLMWSQITTVGGGGAGRPVRHKIPLGILIFLGMGSSSWCRLT